MFDAKTENYLKAGGYAYKAVADFDLSLIDIKAAKINPWRLHRTFDQDRVTSIGCALLDGDDMPAIVVLDEPDGYVLATGLHRTLGALEAKRKTLDAYLVIETDPYRRSLLCRAINVLEGSAPKLDENIAQILDLMRDFPDHSAAELAKAFKLKPGSVERLVRMAKVERRAAELGVAEFSKLTVRHREIMGGIGSDPLFVRTARVLVNTKARAQTGEVLIRDVARSRSEAAGHKMLDAREAEYADQSETIKRIFGKPKTSIPTKAMYAIRRVVKFENDPAWGALEPSELVKSIAIIEEAQSKLRRWQREMTEIRKQHEKKAAWTAPKDSTGAPTSEAISASI